MTPLLALILAMIVTGSGITSAGAMAPDCGDAQLELYQLALGRGLDDLCGDIPLRATPARSATPCPRRRSSAVPASRCG